MTLGDILQKEQIITDLQATDRWAAIDELINHLVACQIGRASCRERVYVLV